MDVSNDKQHVNTVRDFEVGVTKNPVSYIVASSTGGTDKTLLLLDRSLGDVASFKQWSGIIKESAMQTARFLQATAGSQRAAKKKYSQLKERAKRALDNYGRSDRLTFLHIAHLSWS